MIVLKMKSIPVFVKEISANNCRLSSCSLACVSTTARTGFLLSLYRVHKDNHGVLAGIPLYKSN